jgi:hypothetical protein
MDDGQHMNEITTALTRTALLGTSRVTPAFPTPQGATWLAEADTPETQVLQMAAALQLYRRAGYEPDRYQGTFPDPAPRELLPIASAHALQGLHLTVDGPLAVLWGDWVRAAQVAGVRVSPAWVPKMLDRGVKQPEVWYDLAAIVGERGRWLSAQYHAWHYLQVEALIARWETLPSNLRVQAVTALRHKNPGAARDVIAHYCATSPASERVKLAGVLAIGLSADDEPVLEHLRTGATGETRNKITELLARLPDSALVQRMQTRLAQLVKLEPQRSGLKTLLSHVTGATTYTLTITEAWTPDAEAERDGLEVSQTVLSIIEQCIERIPPRWWETHYHISIPDLLHTLAAQNHRDWWTVLGHAAVRFADSRMAEALVVAGASLVPLISALLPQPLTRLLREMSLSQSDYYSATPLWTALATYAHPWSDALALAVLDLMERHATSHSVAYPLSQAHTAVKLFARFPLKGAWMAQLEASFFAKYPWKPVREIAYQVLEYRRELLSTLHAGHPGGR